MTDLSDEAHQVAKQLIREADAATAAVARNADYCAGQILQRGRRTLSNSTAKALNEATGRSLHKGEWGKALEKLKRQEGLRNDYHGAIDDLANYYGPDGEIIGNLEDYLW